MSAPAEPIQHRYPDDVSHCYGCGRLNTRGHQLETYWEDGESVSRFTPEPYYTAIPGYVYGGLIASLLDCHGTGTAAAATERKARGRERSADGPDGPDGPAPRFVTASLQVDFLKPTPLGPELEVRGRVTEMTDRKVVVEANLSAEGEVCARGTVVAVPMPERLAGGAASS